jgi:uncharacterized RDD family membrane protein YckC
MGRMSNTPPPGQGGPYDPSQPPYPPPGPDPYGVPGPYGGPPYDQGRTPYGGPELGASWRRLVARVIDTVIVVVVGTAIALSFSGVHPDDWSGSDQWGIGVITTLVYFLYDGFQHARYGRTLGKRALDLRVVRVQDGRPPTTEAGWTRGGVYTLPLLVPCLGSLFWLVDVLWHLWDHPWRQCLHDKAARTVVIRARGR